MLHNFVLGGLAYPPQKIKTDAVQGMPEHNSLLQQGFFLAAAIFCHDKYMSQKELAIEILARNTVDLLKLVKMRVFVVVARHRLRKQVRIGAKPNKTTYF